MCFLHLFSGVFLNVIHGHSVVFGFVLSSEVIKLINPFLHIQFYCHLSRSKEKIYFLFSYKWHASSWVLFLDIVLIFWPFTYWTLNKQSPETWSCVCGFCPYGLFFAFACSEIFQKHAKKFGVGHRQFDAGFEALSRFLATL